MNNREVEIKMEIKDKGQVKIYVNSCKKMKDKDHKV